MLKKVGLPINDLRNPGGNKDVGRERMAIVASARCTCRVGSWPHDLAAFGTLPMR